MTTNFSFIRRILGPAKILLHNFILFFHYRPWGQHGIPMIIYMIDGSVQHAGLADRLRQVMTIYPICKNKGYKFGLVANHPFELRDYLLPNYNWVVSQNDFSRNIFFSRPLYLGYRSKEKYKKLVVLKRKQLHVYVSVNWSLIFDLGYNMKQLFNELFIPVPQIKEIISQYREKYNKWDCLHFRFLNLLNDFNEPQIHSLSYAEKEVLLGKCYGYIQELARRTRGFLLVCSDSITFLNNVSTIPGVFIIPGEPLHIDYASKEASNSHLKTFVDFFMAAESDSIQSVATKKMYRSDFPVLAAAINDIPFKRIELD